MLVDVLKYRKTFRFDHLLVCKTNVLLDQRLHHFEVLWASQLLLYFLDDKDTVLVFHHALHHVLFLQDLEEFANQALKIIKKKMYLTSLALSTHFSRTCWEKFWIASWVKFFLNFLSISSHVSSSQYYIRIRLKEKKSYL